MQPYRPITQPGWGGLNEDENPSLLRPEELSEVNNAALYGDSLGTRPGIQREGTGQDYENPIDTSGLGGTNDVVKGVYHFTKTGNFQRDVLLAVAWKHLWTDDGTSKAGGAGVDVNSSADNVTCFAQYRGNVWFTNYVSGAVASAAYHWDGAAGTFGRLVINNTVPVNAGNAKYILSKWGYILLAGFDLATPDASSNKMVVRFNNIAADPTLTASWPAANTIGADSSIGAVGGLSEYGGEFITGLAEYQDNDGDWLLILTSRRIVAVVRDWNQISGDPFLVQSGIANGCVHQNAYVNLGLDYGDAVYVSRQGIHSLRQSQEYGGREDTFLSWKIRRTFESLNPNRLQFITGGYDPTEGYVLFAVATGSKATADTILCLDVRDKRSLTADRAKWYIWKMEGTERIKSMTTAPDPNGKLRLYAGGDEGSVGYWQRDTYSDFGSAFSVTWTGKHDDFGAPFIEKSAGDMVVDVQPGGDYVPTLTTVFDFGQRQGYVHRLVMETAGALWEDHTDAAGPTLWADDAGTTGFDWASGDIVTTRKKLYDQGRANTIASRFSHGGKDEPFFISGLTRQIAGAAETIGVEGGEG